MVRRKTSFFIRNAGNVAGSAACIINGIRGQETLGINCIMCGYDTCSNRLPPRETGTPPGITCCRAQLPSQNGDLGVAVGTAVKTASLHDVTTG